MPTIVADCSDPVLERIITSGPFLKATALDANWIYFPRPMTIVSILCNVGTTFATNGYNAGDLEIGTLADPDQYAENTGAITSTQAAGDNIPMTLSSVDIAGGSWVKIKFPASAGAGNFSFTMVVKPKPVE